MNYYVVEKVTDKGALHTAGSKARSDADKILARLGYTPVELVADISRKGGVHSKLKDHLTVKKAWRDAFSRLKSNDTVVLQFPFVNHSIFLKSVIRNAVSRGVTVVALIHDLESLRLSYSPDIPFYTRLRLLFEQRSVLPLFSKLIVHNERMADCLQAKENVKRERMTVLGIFDYLTDAPFAKGEGIVIAANLAIEKSGYAYYLPAGADFNLYGPSYEGIPIKNVSYHGSFAPDKLDYAVSGSFGLVWDGESADSCVGVWGEYLKYNNPHKTSFYLALGLAVIIWRGAALADFVLKNNCGIVVDSLYDIPAAVKNADLPLLQKNARKVAKKLRSGYFLTKAVTS